MGVISNQAHRVVHVPPSLTAVISKYMAFAVNQRMPARTSRRSVVVVVGAAALLQPPVENLNSQMRVRDISDQMPRAQDVQQGCECVPCVPQQSAGCLRDLDSAQSVAFTP